jgi:hypothetical protein
VPKAYDHLTFLTADIANGAALLAKSSAVQYYNFLNKVYTAFDEVLGQFDDIAKIENLGDSYTLVSGVSHDGKNAKAVATTVVELGLALVKIAKELDLTDQITDVAQVRVGIHTGAAVAGVPNPEQPKFAVLGDAPVVAGILEQTSRPHGVHISGITNDTKAMSLSLLPTRVPVSPPSGLLMTLPPSLSAELAVDVPSNFASFMQRVIYAIKYLFCHFFFLRFWIFFFKSNFLLNLLQN